MKRPILISGSHRSGSTWIGKMISYAPGVRYAHEPFNIGIKHINSPFKYWFEYINDGTPPEEQQDIIRYLKTFYALPPRFVLGKIAQIRDYKTGYSILADLKGRISDRTLIKDPIAIMSAPWIYKKTGADVIISIRHPAAFVASLIARDWHFDFNNYLLQKDLMHDLLSDYRSEIMEYAVTPPDILHQGITLWNTIYHVIRGYRELYGHIWQFVRHEDLSHDPSGQFQLIFNKLNLSYTPFVDEKVRESTTATKDTPLIRNARLNVKTWQNRLNPEQIEIIKEGTKHVWKDFYSEEDWK